ncbi:MAG: phosphonate ABC transporter, permease protein PhnE [Clostridia bacterium]|nr:phosphonate ABC transporter, permease protein PhnE [Clostridia bacterium]MBQ3076769.1 phosphonate ABC transporter, permease protein PhnE [Clostridia bacterium]
MSKTAARRLTGPLVLLLLLIGAGWITGCSPALFWERRRHLGDIVTKMLPPDWGFAAQVLPPLLMTVQMSVTGTAVGALLALPAAFFCAEGMPTPRPLRTLLRALVQVLRSFPSLILALFATFLFGFGSFPGTVAITVYTFAILARLTYEDIETAPLAPFRALLAMGTSPFRAYVHALLPAFAPSFLANTLYLLEGNLRHSSILGYVGAGGLGLLLSEKISWREYDKVGMILLLLFVAVWAIERGSAFLGQVIREERRIGRGARRRLSALAALTVIFCTLTLRPPDFAHTSLAMVAAMLRGLVRPDWSFFFDLSAAGLPWLLLETLAIALLGSCAGTLLAAPLAFLNTPRLLPRPLVLSVSALITAIRSVPFLIYGLIFIRVTGPGPFAGVLTLGICSVGLLCKRFTEAIEALDFRAFRALEACGTPRLSAIRHAILPQLAPAFASAVLYRFDINIREASTLGLVGAGGIGAPLVFAMSHYHWEQVSAISLGLILLVFAIDRLSAAARRRAR